jgi:hypothetical protein
MGDKNQPSGNNGGRVIYACDVGTTRQGPHGPAFAWAKISPEEPTRVRVSQDIERLVADITSEIQKGKSVALGLEAPMFIPVPSSAENLSRGRAGEKNRSFAAPAGLAVASLALHQAAWILASLRSSCSRQCDFTTDWKAWPPSDERQRLFFWEAFVSGKAHSDKHVNDAATAVTYFLFNERNLDQANAVTAERPLSLIGTAALWSGWTDDVSVLHSPSLVIMPSQPFKGTLEQF